MIAATFSTRALWGIYYCFTVLADAIVENKLWVSGFNNERYIAYYFLITKIGINLIFASENWRSLLLFCSPFIGH